MNTGMVIEAMDLFPDTFVKDSDKLFAAGSVLNGGASVKQCVREAFETAENVDLFLRQIDS